MKEIRTSDEVSSSSKSWTKDSTCQLCQSSQPGQPCQKVITSNKTYVRIE